jgi:hypothetical protein
MDIFVPFDATHSHTVTFQWRLPNRRTWAIVDDNGPAAILANSLGPDIEKWPVAAGAATVTDQFRGPIIQSSGNGCFTVTATPDTPEPRVLTVDLRPTAPSAPTAIQTSAWPQACR